MASLSSSASPSSLLFSAMPSSRLLLIWWAMCLLAFAPSSLPFFVFANAQTTDFGTGHPFCNICGFRQMITKPDELVAIPTRNTYTCAHLDQRSRDGFVPREHCAALQAFSRNKCGCVPRTDRPTSAPTMTLVPTQAPDDGMISRSAAVFPLRKSRARGSAVIASGTETSTFPLRPGRDRDTSGNSSSNGGGDGGRRLLLRGGGDGAEGDPENDAALPLVS